MRVSECMFFSSIFRPAGNILLWDIYKTLLDIGVFLLCTLCPLLYAKHGYWSISIDWTSIVLSLQWLCSENKQDLKRYCNTWGSGMFIKDIRPRYIPHRQNSMRITPWLSSAKPILKSHPGMTIIATLTIRLKPICKKGPTGTTGGVYINSTYRS